MDGPNSGSRDEFEQADLSSVNQGVVGRTLDWISDNWNEESNLGKAKLAGLLALVFMFIITLLPGQQERQGVDPKQQVQAGAAVEQAISAQHDSEEPGVENRSATADIAQEATDGEHLADATQQARETYDQYESRIAQLESEKRTLEKDAPKTEEALQSAADQAAETYDQYESRISQLESEKRTLEKDTPKTGEALQAAAEQASDTYADYEERVAMLEMEKRELTKRLTDAEVALEKAQQELAELKQTLEQQRSESPASSAVEELGQEMKKQLESLQSLIDKLLNGTEQQGDAPPQVQPL